MAAKKNIRMRLYRRHDLDLIALYKNPDFGFQKAMRRALHCYAAGKPFCFSAPPLRKFEKETDIKSSYMTYLRLDEERDADIIALLERVKPLYKNEFIKMVLRGAMVGPYAYCCLKDSGEAEEAAELIAGNISSIEDRQICSPPKPREDRKKSRKTEDILQESRNEKTAGTETEIKPEKQKKQKKQKFPAADVPELIPAPLYETPEPEEITDVTDEDENEEEDFFASLGNLLAAR